MQQPVYLALGTNLGDRLNNLHNALAALPPQVEPQALSPVYETLPWGYLEQPPFLNQVVRAATSLPPLDLLDFLKGIEAQMGRQPTLRNGPRLIDLDILFYDNLVLDDARISIPHPRLHERAFVLVPLADLAPELVHPVLKKTIRELLAGVDISGVKLFQVPSEG